MNPILIDTNLLVYLYDRRNLARQDIARQVVGTLAKLGIGRLSSQCLSEFFNAVIKQKANQESILSINDAAAETVKLAQTFSVYPVTQQVVLEALRGYQQYKMQFWDAQIWASAHLNQVPVIFTQDFNSGSILEGIRFINPFDAKFKLMDWIN